jgi:hypothetical protein
MFVLWERAMPAILQRPFARMARSYGSVPHRFDTTA